jgi:hypothetical protein
MTKKPEYEIPIDAGRRPDEPDGRHRFPVKVKRILVPTDLTTIEGLSFNGRSKPCFPAPFGRTYAGGRHPWATSLKFCTVCFLPVAVP